MWLLFWTSIDSLLPQWSYLNDFRSKNKKFKASQQHHYNRRHKAKDLPPIPDDTDVWITSEENPIRGRVTAPADSPRSYIVETPSGQLHRNRCHLNVVPPQQDDQANTPDVQPKSPVKPPSPNAIMTRSRAAKQASLKRGDVAKLDWTYYYH